MTQYWKMARTIIVKVKTSDTSSRERLEDKSSNIFFFAQLLYSLSSS